MKKIIFILLFIITVFQILNSCKSKSIPLPPREPAYTSTVMLPTFTVTETVTITTTNTVTFTPTYTITSTPICQIYYRDNDGDGYGISNDYNCLTTPSGQYSAVIPGDCNDNNAQIYPGNTEKCNGFDDNCDNLTDVENSYGCTIYYKDSDQDGYGVTNDSKCLCSQSGQYSAIQSGDCNDIDPTANPGQNEICGNGKDDNCDGLVDNCTP